MLRDPYGFIQKRCRTHGADLLETPDAGEFGENDSLLMNYSIPNEHWSNWPKFEIHH